MELANKIKINKILSIPLFGIGLGFLIGLILGIIYLFQNKHIYYQVFRLLFIDIREHLNFWVFTISVTVIGFSLLLWLLFKLIRFFIKDKGTAKTILGAIICGLTILILGWIVSDRIFYIATPVSDLKNFTTSALLKSGAIILICATALGIIIGNISPIPILNIVNNKYIQKISFFSLIILILLNIGLFIEKKINIPTGPNFLIIVIDALRPDHLESYGYNRNTAPNITDLAEKGIVFKKAFANSPWTKPSVATIFTGLYPNLHKAISITESLPKQVLTLAEILKNKGYNTYFLNAGNINIDKIYNFTQGFDENISPNFPVILKYPPQIIHEKMKASIYADKFINLISEKDRRPFFAYIHFMDTHTPYNINKYNNNFTNEVAGQFLGPGKISSSLIRKLTAANQLQIKDKEYIVALYDGQIRFVDEEIGKIITKLKELNLLNNTVIFITSDHGEEFWEHNGFEHGHTLYNELLQIPLIISGYNTTPLETNYTVQLADLFNTIAELADTNTIISKNNGQSFADLINGANLPDISKPIFATGTHFGDEKYSLMKNQDKIIFNTGITKNKKPFKGYKNPNVTELYDLNNDPHEKIDLANKDIKRSDRLKKELDIYINKKSSFKSKSIKMDKETRERLKSLGYIQ